MFNRTLIDAVARLTERVRDCEQKIVLQSSTALLVRVNELESALAQLQKSNRKELGKLWQLVDTDKLHQPPAGNDVRVQHDEFVTGDPEFDAMIALQRAHGST